jgi:hypothetical protein
MSATQGKVARVSLSRRCRDYRPGRGDQPMHNMASGTAAELATWVVGRVKSLRTLAG